jgi:hypothetical protein
MTGYIKPLTNEGIVWGYQVMIPYEPDYFGSVYATVWAARRALNTDLATMAAYKIQHNPLAAAPTSAKEFKRGTEWTRYQPVITMEGKVWKGSYYVMKASAGRTLENALRDHGLSKSDDRGVIRRIEDIRNEE